MQDFDELDTALLRARAAADAAETHGFLSGVVCSTGRLDSQSWLTHLLGELDLNDVLVQECQAVLHDVYQDVYRSLNSSGLEFELLLPDDDDPLRERAEALGNWSQGFLSGLGAGGLGNDQSLSQESSEMLKDLSEIAKVQFDIAVAGDEDEHAYAEIVEYVRVGVVLLNEELQPIKAPPQLQ